MRCFSSPGSLCAPMHSAHNDLAVGLPHSEILGSQLGYQLPKAYRRFPRPSSPLDAKTSTMRPLWLDHAYLTSPSRASRPLPETTLDLARLAIPHSLRLVDPARAGLASRCSRRRRKDDSLRAKCARRSRCHSVQPSALASARTVARAHLCSTRRSTDATSLPYSLVKDAPYA